ncbi:MAG TPA: pitrilysin family protein [bacterium]|nr:pitrilysin family protein [bacterium]
MLKPFKTTLSNGLRVLLLESHTAPVVSWNLWANVGSVNETDDEAGLCHLIEHMIFKGTGRRPVGQIAKEVEAAGGDMNAYTSFDETVFYINMSAKNMDVGLDILADATIDPTFDETELTREKEVVVEEISRSEDNPSQMVSQDLFSAAFSLHPYRRPIAGSRETVRGVSRQHLKEFYHRWYVGSNLILIGVGDFQVKDILPKVETLFSKIPAGTVPAQKIPAEPPQIGRRTTTRGMTIEGRYFDLSVPIPGLMHADTPALDLLSHILGSGGSSRLEQGVKEKKGLVTAVASYAYTPRHPGLMIVGGVLKEKALKETLKAVWEEIERMKHEPPTTVEFARARESLRSARIYERQTVEAMARKIGYFEGIAGDVDFEETYYRRLAEVTPEDIQRLAQTYFIPERISLSFCHSKAEKWPDEKLADWLTEAVETPRKAKPARKPEGETVDFKLKNGIRVLIRENRNLPLVSIRSGSIGGLRAETKKMNGASHLISSLLTKGTVSRTAREISEESDSLNGHIDGYMGRNLLGVSGTFLSDKIVEGLDLFFDVLLHPIFPKEEVAKEIGHTLTAIRNEEDSLAGLAMKKFMAALYPKHPYGLPSLGTAQTVRSFNRERLLRHYFETVRPDNMILSVVGDVSADDIRERLTEKLSSWKALRAKAGRIDMPTPPKKAIEIVTLKKKLQAHIVYGFLGTTVKNADRFALEVMNYVLAGQGGRLFIELRDKRGLAYAVSSSTQEGLEPGYITVYMGTDVSKLDDSLKGIREELDRIRREPVLEEEIERAKRFIIGNYALDLQKNSSIAAMMAYHVSYGMPPDEIFKYPERIERVTREDILRVAKKYLRPEASVLSVIRN